MLAMNCTCMSLPFREISDLQRKTARPVRPDPCGLVRPPGPAASPCAGAATLCPGRWCGPGSTPTPTGFVLEVEEAWAGGGEQWDSRELFRADVAPDGITGPAVYCTGDRDGARRAQHAREVGLIRPWDLRAAPWHAAVGGPGGRTAGSPVRRSLRGRPPSPAPSGARAALRPGSAHRADR